MFIKVGLTVNIGEGLGVNLKITNNGITNLTNITWKLKVKGAFSDESIKQ